MNADLKPGFYWCRAFRRWGSDEVRAVLPAEVIVMELTESGHWYLSGIEGAEREAPEVLSERLEPPLMSKRDLTTMSDADLAQYETDLDIAVEQGKGGTEELGVSIRKMLPQDVPFVESLLISVWPDSSRVRRTVRGELEDMFSNAEYRPIFFVAVNNLAKVIGCGAWNWSWLNYGIYDICWGCVRPDYRGRGLGRALVEARLADIAEHSRSEGEANHQVLTSTHRPEIYERYGFKPVMLTPDGTSLENASYLMVLNR